MSNNQTNAKAWTLARTRFDALIQACVCIEDKFYARLEGNEPDPFFEWLAPPERRASTRLKDVPAHAFVAIDLAFLASGILSDPKTKHALDDLKVASRPVPDWLRRVVSDWYDEGTSGVTGIWSYPLLPRGDDKPAEVGTAGNFEAIAWFLSMSADLLDEVLRRETSPDEDSTEPEDPLLEKITATCTQVLQTLGQYPDMKCFFGVPLSNLYRTPEYLALKAELWTDDDDALPKAGNCLHTVGVHSISSAMRVMRVVLEGEEGIDRTGWRGTSSGRDARTDFRKALKDYEGMLRDALKGHDKWKLPSREDAMLVGDGVQLAHTLLQANDLYRNPDWLADARRIAKEMAEADLLDELRQPIGIELRAKLDKRGGPVPVQYQRDYLLPLFAKLETEIAEGLLNEGKVAAAGVHLERACGILEGLVVRGDRVALDRDTGLVAGPLALQYASAEDSDSSAASLAQAHAIVFTGSVQDALAYLMWVLTGRDLVQEPMSSDRDSTSGDGHESSRSFQEITRSFGVSFRQLVKAAVLENEAEAKKAKEAASQKLLEEDRQAKHGAVDGRRARLADEPLSAAVIDLQALRFLARLFLAYVRKRRVAEDEVDELPTWEDYLGLEGDVEHLVMALAWRKEPVHPVMVHTFVLRWQLKKPEEWFGQDYLEGVDPRKLWQKRAWCVEAGDADRSSSRTPVQTNASASSSRSGTKKAVHAGTLEDHWFGFLTWVDRGCLPGGS